MAIPFIGPILNLGSTIVGGINDHFEGNRKIKQAITENKCRLAANRQSHNQDWEMKQLDGSGWKDDALFYAWLLFFAWTAYDPESAKQVFDNWNALPDWFIQITGVIIGSVVGVKKLGDTLPGLFRGIKDVLKKDP